MVYRCVTQNLHSRWPLHKIACMSVIHLLVHTAVFYQMYYIEPFAVLMMCRNCLDVTNPVFVKQFALELVGL